MHVAHRWLKSHWILLSEGESEIKESIALSFGRSIVPQASASVLKRHVDVSLCHSEMQCDYNICISYSWHMNAS